MMYEAKVHETKCPGCKADLTQLQSVKVHFSLTDHEFDQLSSVDQEGVLQDIDGMVELGHHAGSYCGDCDEQLEELEGVEAEKWYVRDEGTGAISGPLSKEVALGFEGLAFSEQIFSPEISTSPDLLDRNKNLANVAHGLNDELVDARTHLNKLEQSIITLSQELADAQTKLVQPVDFSVGVLIAELQSLREAQEIIRNGEDDSIGTLLKQVMNVLIHLSREKVIECSLDSGVFDVVSEMPPGVTILIRDYDIEGTDEDDGPLVEDPDGRECLEREYAERT